MLNETLKYFCDSQTPKHWSTQVSVKSLLTKAIVAVQQCDQMLE